MTGDDFDASAWGDLPADQLAALFDICRHYRTMVPDIDPDGVPETTEAIAAVLAWQQLEIEVATAHGDWLSKTRAKFKRRGWPWTIEEIARRSRLREVGE